MRPLPDFPLSYLRPPTIALDGGQIHCFHLAAARVLQVHQGQVRLTLAPQWLGERLCRVSCTLSAGQQHRNTQGGWVMLEALEACSFSVARLTMPRWRSWLQQCAFALKRLRPQY